MTDLEKMKTLLNEMQIKYRQIDDEERIIDSDQFMPLVVLDIDESHLADIYNAKLLIRFTIDGKFKNFHAFGE